jgi:hypothetical protein
MGNTPRINVDNHAAWGKLVKSWATGRDYVTFVPTAAKPVPDEPAAGATLAFPKPTSFKDMVTTCQKHQVGLHFVPTATSQKTFCTGDEPIGFVLLQGSPEISILRLPAKEKVHESENAMTGAGGAASADYPVPAFYGDVFGDGSVPASIRPMTVLEKMEFHAKRVGEYTINTCW